MIAYSIEVRNIDLKRLLHDQERHTFGARRGGKGTSVLQDRTVRDVVLDAREVETLLDGRLGSGLFNRGEVRGDARDDGIRGLGGELEHKGHDGDLGGIVCAASRVSIVAWRGMAWHGMALSDISLGWWADYGSELGDNDRGG